MKSEDIYFVAKYSLCLGEIETVIQILNSEVSVCLFAT